MASVRNTSIFNRSDRFVEGWYWALRSADVPRGTIKAVRLQGRDIVLYRGESGRVIAMDAHCPHMGAHFAQGRVDGDSIRCFFHDWKFGADGTCSHVPCLKNPPRARVRTWPAAERYGLVWVWTGDEPTRPVPFVPEIGEDDCDAILGGTFVKKCHPNVMMINAIDEHHFNSVHDLPVDLYMRSHVVHDNLVTFSNTTKLPPTNPLTRVVGQFYAGPLTYSMAYWFGSTGTVTVGPDFFHFHIMFALRMRDGGGTEGQTILITKKRHGLAGQAVSRPALAASKAVGDYFAKGDTMVFETIKFDLQTPTKADHAIVEFIQHVEGQRAVEWGTWSNVPATRVSLQVTS